MIEVETIEIEIIETEVTIETEIKTYMTRL